MPRLPDDVAPVFERFVRAPVGVRAALDGLDAAALNRRPPGEDWSIRDVVIHLCDAELMRAGALRLAIAEEEGAIPAWDAEQFKRRLHYVFRNPELALALYETTRFANGELLQQLAPAAWERTVTRGDGSTDTIAGLLTRAANHDAEHIAQIAEMRRAVGG